MSYRSREAKALRRHGGRRLVKWERRILEHWPRTRTHRYIPKRWHDPLMRPLLHNGRKGRG